MLFSIKQYIVAALVTIGLLLAFGSFGTIDSGYRGLLFTFGKMDKEVMKDGLYGKMPLIQRVEELSIKTQQLDIEVNVNERGAITKDNQTVGSTISVFFKYEENKLDSLYLLGIDQVLSALEKTSVESFKKEIGKYSIFDVAQAQESIRKNTFNTARESFADYPLDIVDFRITNYDWSEAFDAQIEKTMQIAQEVKQKQQELEKEMYETQKKVKGAEASKQSAILDAEGAKESAKLRAEAKFLEGDGIRKYNEQIRATLDIELKLRQLTIEQTRASRWNGKEVADNWYSPIPVNVPK